MKSIWKPAKNILVPPQRRLKELATIIGGVSSKFEKVPKVVISILAFSLFFYTIALECDFRENPTNFHTFIVR